MPCMYVIYGQKPDNLILEIRERSINPTGGVGGFRFFTREESDTQGQDKVEEGDSSNAQEGAIWGLRRGS